MVMSSSSGSPPFRHGILSSAWSGLRVNLYPQFAKWLPGAEVPNLLLLLPDGN